MPAPNLGPQYDLATRLAALEDQVRRMQANPLGQAFSATQSDGSIGWQVYQDPTSGGTSMVFRQGPTTARDSNTAQHPPLLYIGQLYSGGVPVDSGAIWSRPDGSQSAVIGNRGVQLFDQHGQQVFAADEYGSSPSGEGLRNPYLSLPLPQSTATAQWPQTDPGAGGQIAWSQFIAQHQNVTWLAQATAEAGTNGTVQLNLYGPGGLTVSGASHPITGGAFTYVSDNLVLPSGFWQQAWLLSVNATVAGTGKVYAQTIEAYGYGN